MNCPECGGRALAVDSRNETSHNVTKAIRPDPFPALGVTVCVRRRRECSSCQARFTTWEIPEPIIDRAEAIAEAVDVLQRAGRIMLADQERIDP